jgi:outer membrane cobalamin receptor
MICSGVSAVNVQKSMISGLVTNEKGAPLAFANVYLEGRTEGGVTDENGRFSFSVTPADSVVLICNYMGFDEYRKTINLTAGQVFQVKITLTEKPVEGKSVTITVSSFTSGEEEGVTLTPLEVVSTPGAAADVFWAIKTYPGVQQVDEGAGLFVRGGDVSETIVIIDGAYLNHPYRYESPNGGFFGTISPFLLKGTYFSSGGYSAEYGNALSGALVMESQDLPAKTHLTAGAGLAALSASAGVLLKPESFGMSFSGNYSDTRPMFQLNGNRQKFSRYPFSYDLNFNTMYRYSTHGSLKLFAYREVDKIGIEVRNPTYGGYYEGDSKNNLMNLQWKQLTNFGILLGGNLSYSQFQSTQNLVVLNLKTTEQLYQFHFAAEYNWTDDIKLKSGIDAFDNEVNLQGNVPRDEEDFDPNAPFHHLDLDYRSGQMAAFFQGDWTLYKCLVIQPGVRTEYESNISDFIIDPGLSLGYQFASNWNLSLAVGKYHQFPEPYYFDTYAGNPYLSPMRARHYIAGMTYQKNNTIYRVEAYYKSYNQLLKNDTTLNYTNNGSGFAKGIDLFLKKSVGKLNGWISYSFLKARRNWMDTPGMVSPDFDITHNLNTVLEINFSEHWKSGIAYRFATGKPYTSALNRYNDSRVPAYQKLDFNLTYLYRFFENNLTVFYFGLSNILGRDNIFDYYYSPDYQKREAIKSSMLRTAYFGVSFSM